MDCLVSAREIGKMRDDSRPHIAGCDVRKVRRFEFS